MASIRERTSRAGETTWAVLWREGGKQTSMTFATPKAAQRFKDLVELLGPAKAIAEVTDADSRPFTVDDLAAAFFEWKGRDVTARTLADYRRDYENWIKPALGSRRAASVDELDVQQLVDKMADRLDPKSVADRHMILHSMFRFGAAKVRRLVDHNPCLETQLPRRIKKPPKGVTLPEWYALLAAARRIEPDAADLMLFIVGTGWRWSEAATLPVRNVEEWADEDGRDRMFVTMRQVNRQGVVVADAAKSYAGFRRAEVTPVVADMLRRRLVGKSPDDLVFTNGSGRPWRQQNFLNRTWTRIVATSGLERRPTPHMLRHAHVPLMDRAGATLPQMQRRMGHEDIQTTINVYGGMIDDIGADVLAAMDAMLLPTPTAGEVVAGEVAPREIG